MSNPPCVADQGHTGVPTSLQRISPLGLHADSVLTYTLISLSVEIGRYDHQWTARHFEIIAVVCSRALTLPFIITILIMRMFVRLILHSKP